MPKILEGSLCQICKHAVYAIEVKTENFVKCEKDAEQKAELEERENCNDFEMEEE